MTQNKDNRYNIIIYSDDPLQKNDNTLKQFFDRFYVIPKNGEYTEEQIEFLNQKAIYPANDKVREGKDGYLIFRGRKKKVLTEEQCKEIRESNLTQMQLAKQYKVSIGTINKVKNNKY